MGIHSEDKTIPITNYTGLTMKTYYVIFLVGMMFHFLVMLIKHTKEVSKMDHESPKKKQRRSSISPFLRAFTSFVIPEVSKDWDEIEGLDLCSGEYKNVVEKYSHQWKSVKREYILIVLLHAIENFLLVLPAIYTYSNVMRPNSFLQDLVGLLPLESIATQRWGWIIVLIPSLIIMSVPLQL